MKGREETTNIKKSGKNAKFRGLSKLVKDCFKVFIFSFLVK
jgi:hypothetical protein